jgi:NitT/TauT family transport system substrate-binding protein
MRHPSRRPSRFLAALALIAAGWAAAPTVADAQARTRIRYALGDIVTLESLPLLIAIDRVKARGVDVEIISLKSEELAMQAVVNGQADIGQGTPYAAMQKLSAPIRFVYQLNALQFFPVVNKEAYKSWKDLDGQEVVVHSRGSGTEAIMRLMAERQGIKYKAMSYVPGSEVRALAMLKGTIKASIVDATNKNLLFREAPDKFLVLPTGEVKASDESMFATRAWIDAHRDAVQALLEESLKVWRAMVANPQFVVDERKRLGLLKDLPAKLEGEMLPYFQQGVQNGIFPTDGGAARAPKDDLEFFTISGALKGTPAELKVEDFWYLDPLQKALARVGK